MLSSSFLMLNHFSVLAFLAFLGAWQVFIYCGNLVPLAIWMIFLEPATGTEEETLSGPATFFCQTRSGTHCAGTGLFSPRDQIWLKYLCEWRGLPQAAFVEGNRIEKHFIWPDKSWTCMVTLSVRCSVDSVGETRFKSGLQHRSTGH